MNNTLHLFASAFAFALLSLGQAQSDPSGLPSPFETRGSIESYSPEFDELVSPDAKIEILAEGFRWSEGPVWDAAKDRLLFTDVPENTAYAWSEEDGLSIFLQPSGHSELNPEGFREAGANGLAFAPDGRLAICQHGNQQVALYDEDSGLITPLVDRYEDQNFYSPNDLVYANNGTLFFTDPPYGLPMEKHEGIETHYVYRLDPNGNVQRVVDSIRYPNGVALSPDNNTLYVASSDWRTPAVYSIPLDSELNVSGEPTLLFDATAYRSDSLRGGCDGMAIVSDGNIWTTGPGGVYVIKPNGKLIGFLNVEGRIANCAFGGPQGTTLYMTAANKLLRIETLVTAVQN
ncbi:SMP-30/gluconolactonase/LRE family protein [Pelagicoccus sp. SDUM812002]|uniref:SMP-30/gluconolactonase/LRE family protein n=1 Tax=Pelagicoccus sp. SDUM812002 TaxID=3041266 RepID=UPI0028102290|nr:SMP-30/gluconolactonase/LRE family protein [Pelagicoccus sp. SDUM812002]MDQ8184677.1 SMP-30/gluconolactonase/LRE family protein [Pelagicoccus sp. SDUM812002]